MSHAPNAQRAPFPYRPLAAVLLVDLLLLARFYDCSWVAADDGFYVHLADRLLHGEILHKSVSEFHTDYPFFIDALSLKLFGERMISLRYPAAAATLLQSCLAFVVFFRRNRNAAVAVLAALIATSVGFIEISCPASHVYTPFLSLLAAALLTGSSPSSAPKVAACGFLATTAFLFRQLTGFYLAAGILYFLLTDAAGDERAAEGGFAARTVLGGLFLLIGALVLRTMKPSAALLFGAWPLVILAKAMSSGPLKGNKKSLRILGAFCAGAAAGFIPMLIYLLSNGSLFAWFRDVWIESFRLPLLPHIRVLDHAYYYLGAALAVMDPSPRKLWNAAYWILIVSAAFMNGALCFKRTPRDPLPILAVFYALVSGFNAVPFYLYATAGFSLLGLLSFIESSGTPVGRRWGMAALAAACAVAVVSHAGQGGLGEFEGVLEGRRMELSDGGALERSGLRLEQNEESSYVELIRTIQAESGAADPILVLPNNAEVYFLADRKNPFRFFNSTISLATEEELQNASSEIASRRPVLVVHNTASLYDSASTARILAALRPRYSLIKRVDHFDVYRLKI